MDVIFSCGLRQHLFDALVSISSSVPPIVPKFEDKFVYMLYGTLVPDSSKEKLSQVTSGREPVAEGRDVEAILLCMNLLQIFKFTNHSSDKLINDLVIPLFNDDEVEVRKKAIQTCRSFVSFQVISQSAAPQSDYIFHLSKRLLSIAISDPDASVRLTVIETFSGMFEEFLARKEDLNSLMLCSNDESFPIRISVIRVLKNISFYNATDTFPLLRKLLIKAVTEVEYADANRQGEECVSILREVLAFGPKLVDSYMDAIMRLLLPKCRNSNPRIASLIMECIHELTLIGCDNLRPYIDQLYVVTMDFIQDQSSFVKRKAALGTIRNLAMQKSLRLLSTQKLSNLVNTLLAALRNEQNPDLVRIATTALGHIGALDPYKFRALSNIPTEFLKENGVSTEPVAKYGPSSVEYFPSISLTALLKMLTDSTLAVHHTAVMNAIVYIVKSLGTKSKLFLRQLIPPVLSFIQQINPALVEFYFQQLGTLISVIKADIVTYMGGIITVIETHWTSTQITNVHNATFSLIEQIALALERDFRVYLHPLLSKIIGILESDTSEKRAFSLRVLRTLTHFAESLEDHLYSIIPVITKCISRDEWPLAVRKQALRLIYQLARKTNLSEEATSVIQHLIRLLYNTNSDIRTCSMDALCALARKMRKRFIVFVPSINKALSANNIQHPQFEALISKIMRNGHLPAEVVIEIDGTIEVAAVDTSVDWSKKLPVNQNNLKKAWETSQRSTKEDWNEWMRRFSLELLKESPSHALRACSSVTVSYYPLSRELFNASFVSCWGELYDQFQVNTLEKNVIIAVIVY